MPMRTGRPIPALTLIADERETLERWQFNLALQRNLWVRISPVEPKF